MLIEVLESIYPSTMGYRTSVTSWLNTEHIAYIGAATFPPIGAALTTGRPQNWVGTVIELVGRKDPVYIQESPKDFVRRLWGQTGATDAETRAARGIRIRGHTEKVADA